MMAASRGLGFGHALPEAAITLGAHHLLLRGVPSNPGLAMHAVLDKTSANLTLARLQVLRMDAVRRAECCSRKPAGTGLGAEAARGRAACGPCRPQWTTRSKTKRPSS